MAYSRYGVWEFIQVAQEQKTIVQLYYLGY